MAEKLATLKEVMAFFGMTPKEFTPEWKKMTEQDRHDVRAGIADGSLTY